MSKSDHYNVRPGPGRAEACGTGASKTQVGSASLWQSTQAGSGRACASVAKSGSQESGAGMVKTSWLHPTPAHPSCKGSLGFPKPRAKTSPTSPPAGSSRRGLSFSTSPQSCSQRHWACHHSSTETAAPLLKPCSSAQNDSHPLHGTDLPQDADPS